MHKITTILIGLMLTVTFTVLIPVKISDAADPKITVLYPVNNNDATYNPRLSIQVTDDDNDGLTVLFRTNKSGAWETLGTYSGNNGVYAQNTSDMMIKNNTYYWSANVTDGTTWVNATYHFFAKPFVLKWYHDTHAYTSITPLAVDVNGDGIYEIFSTGVNNVTCLNGNNGAQIWRKQYPYILNHSAFEIGDLNSDGVPEIVISGDITFAGAGHTIALHANDGSLYWNVTAESAQKYVCIADTDGTGYPYVYICSGDPNEGTNGDGRLYKLRGTTGAIIKSTYVWRPCWGGPSIADADNDGKFEVYLCDRKANYAGHPNGPYGQLGLGMQCFDADTLDLLWYQDALTCSSHMLMIADVNGDGVLDAVACNQAGRSSGIYTVDGATYDKMPGKWENIVTGLNSSHSTPALGDCDGDGRLELITCSNGPQCVWDMGTWELETKLPNAPEPPCIADVYGDSGYEIISGSYEGGPVQVFDGKTYTLLENISPGGIAHFCVQDIDNDFQNELITISSGGIIRAYDTSAYIQTPRQRTNNQYFSERRTSVATFTPIPGAPQPIIKSVSPVDNAQDVSLSPTLHTQIIDYHHDLMDITISTNATGPWTDLATYHNVGNGWHNISAPTINQRNTTYYWRVSAFDPSGDRLWTNKTYHFTTLASPRITNIDITPVQQLPGSNVNISCNVTDGTTVNLVKVDVTNPLAQRTNYTASGGTPSWSVLTYDTFESGWGNYTDGGSDCARVSSTNSYEGTHSARIDSYLGLNSSFYLSTPIDVDTPRYTKLKVDFWFRTTNMSNLTNFWVKYYDGQHWRIVDNFIKYQPQGNRPTDKIFENDTFTHAVTWINETTYNFSKDMKIRFECDALTSYNNVYIDKIYINATTAQGLIRYLNRTYSTLGTYTYYIWANDNSGNGVRTGAGSFIITGNPQPYMPDNPSPSNGSTTASINTDLSWTGGDPDPEDNVTYDVYFGASSSPSLVSTNQSALSYDPGTLSYSTTYYWRIIAWDSSNNSTIGPLWHFKTVAIHYGGGGGSGGSTNDLPIADLSAGEPYHGNVGDTITFNGSRSRDTDGTITKYSWLFGDNTNATGAVVQHTYTKKGNYTVTLTVTDNEGAKRTDTTICTIIQPNRAPTPPTITGNSTGSINTKYQFTVVSTDADNDTIQYVITWGDGTTSNTSEFLPNGTAYPCSHQWTTAGIYTVSVQASDQNNMSLISSHTILIGVKYIGENGYLIDQNGDGTYDHFYDNQTTNETSIQRQTNGTYLLDTNGDGTPDHLFDPSTSTLAPYTPKTPGFEFLVVLCAMVAVLFLWRKKRIT